MNPSPLRRSREGECGPGEGDGPDMKLRPSRFRSGLHPNTEKGGEEC